MLTEVDKSQMFQARSLIQAKRYREAQNLLVNIDHPTARDWLAKIDDLFLGDPFEQAVPVSSKPAIPSLLQPATNVMTRNGWEVVGTHSNFVEFRKKQGPNPWVAALIILIFSLIGTAVICLWIATSGFVNASLSDNGDGTLTLMDKYGSEQVTDLLYLDDEARSVKSGATYGGAIAGGVIMFIIAYTVFSM